MILGNGNGKSSLQRCKIAMQRVFAKALYTKELLQTLFEERLHRVFAQPASTVRQAGLSARPECKDLQMPVILAMQFRAMRCLSDGRRKQDARRMHDTRKDGGEDTSDVDSRQSIECATMTGSPLVSPLYVQSQLHARRSLLRTRRSQSQARRSLLHTRRCLLAHRSLLQCSAAIRPCTPLWPAGDPWSTGDCADGLKAIKPCDCFSFFGGIKAIVKPTC